jgi:hypothetical protein
MDCREDESMYRALRVVAVLHAISLFLQPVLAGLFLSGDDAMIDVHADNGLIVTILCLVQTVFALVLWRKKVVVRSIFTTSLALFLLEGIQLSVGFQHVMWLHIPLGTMLLAGTAVLMTRIMAPQGIVLKGASE